MMQRFLLAWLLVTSAIALFWPYLGIPFDPFLEAGGTGITTLIVVVMFCIGTLLPTSEVNAVARRWPTVVTGTAIQYLSMPLLAWLMVLWFSPPPATAAGILIVGCVPGAMASNVLTLTAHGNVSYSVSLTTSATLLSPLVVPAILGITLAQEVNYDGGRAVSMLTLTVVLPVVAGHLFRRLLNNFPGWLETVCENAASAAILGIVSIAVALRRGELQQTAWMLLGILAVINAGGFVAGYTGGLAIRLPEPMRRALTLEVGMQNAGVGTGLAVRLFGEDSPAILPCILYTFGCMLTGTILATIWNVIPPRKPADCEPGA